VKAWAQLPVWPTIRSQVSATVSHDDFSGQLPVRRTRIPRESLNAGGGGEFFEEPRPTESADAFAARYMCLFRCRGGKRRRHNNCRHRRDHSFAQCEPFSRCPSATCTRPRQRLRNGRNGAATRRRTLSVQGRHYPIKVPPDSAIGLCT